MRLVFFSALALALSGCGKVELYSALPEQEVNEMLALLLSSQVHGDKFAGKDETYGIRVPKRDVERSIQLLKSKGYPRRVYTGLGDVFAKSGVVSSSIEQEAKYTYAITQELSETLGHIDGVLAARVHVSLGQHAPGQKSQHAVASTFIKYDPSYDVEGLKPQIKDLVANSVAGLNPDDIAVVLVPSELTAPPPAPADRSAHWQLPALAVLAGLSLLANMGLLFVRRRK